MTTKQGAMTPRDANTADVDRTLQVLTMEYGYLSAQILARLSARYQFLGFLTAGAAILAAGSSGSVLKLGTWILPGLAIGIFLFGLLCFWLLGRTIVEIAAHIVEIEERINQLVPVEPGTPKLLRWESGQQHPSGHKAFIALILGLQRSRKTNLRISPHDGFDDQ